MSVYTLPEIRTEIAKVAAKYEELRLREDQSYDTLREQQGLEDDLNALRREYYNMLEENHQ